jgi:hypothetical protein
MELTEFWISVKDEYPLVSAKAQRILIPFATSYLCEAGFLAVGVIKSEYRVKINAEKEMRVAVSKLVEFVKLHFVLSKMCFIYFYLTLAKIIGYLKCTC